MGLVLYAIFRGLRIPFVIASLVTILFARYEGYFAGEWVIGFEAKSFAWLFAFLGLALAVFGKNTMAVAAVVIATIFHTLVGGYSLIALVAAVLFDQKSRQDLLGNQVNLGLLSILVICVVVFVAFVVTSNPNVDVQTLKKAIDIYIFFRLPHHLVPKFEWFAMVTVISPIFFIGVRSSYRQVRLQAIYGLTSCSYVWIAWLAGLLGFVELYALYLGRHSSVMVPFVASLIVAFVAHIENYEVLNGLTGF